MTAESTFETVASLEAREADLRRELSAARAEQSRLAADLASARNACGGWEKNSRDDAAEHFDAARREVERLAPLVASAEARVRDLEERLAMTRADLKALLEGPDRVALAVARFRAALAAAEQAQADLVAAQASRRTAAEAVETAAAAVAAAEAVRDHALTVAEMAGAREALDTARAAQSDAARLTDNLERRVQACTQNLARFQTAADKARRSVFGAKSAELAGAIGRDLEQIWMGYAASVSAGDGDGFVPYVARLFGAGPPPADLEKLQQAIAAELGVPARPVKFRSNF